MLSTEECQAIWGYYGAEVYDGHICVHNLDTGSCSVSCNIENRFFNIYNTEKVQVGKDQEKAQSEKDSYSKNRGGKKPN